MNKMLLNNECATYLENVPQQIFQSSNGGGYSKFSGFSQDRTLYLSDFTQQRKLCVGFRGPLGRILFGRTRARYSEQEASYLDKSKPMTDEQTRLSIDNCLSLSDKGKLSKNPLLVSFRVDRVSKKSKCLKYFGSNKKWVF